MIDVLRVVALLLLLLLVSGNVGAYLTTPIITTRAQLLAEIDSWLNGNTNGRTAIGTWNVSGLSDFRWAFYHRFSFDDDISNWDVSGAKNMRGMFRYAQRYNQDLSGWNVSSVIDMSGMFADASTFDQDISGWDTSGVREMKAMFYGAGAFNQNISIWDVSSVIDMQWMFWDAWSFNQDLCVWGSKLPRNVDISYAFAGSNCSHTSDPDLFDSPPSPFCCSCTPIRIAQTKIPANVPSVGLLGYILPVMGLIVVFMVATGLLWHNKARWILAREIELRSIVNPNCLHSDSHQNEGKVSIVYHDHHCSIAENSTNYNSTSSNALYEDDA